ncbi:Peptidase M23 [Rubrivivax sp. A210]|uniref:M23 family metallopeptidase n=1 Tax=Rubrivivax sp. A210 TaxID=2772301 RepID=UPI00191A239B|nr:Peptidase M23 [Rubrivivax sp. A210]
MSQARQHRRGIVVSAVVAMAGFAVTAVAVAPLVPDAGTLPQTIVTEPVQPAGLDAQLDALAAHDLQLTRSDITRATDSAETLLARLGVRDAAAATFLRHNASARALLGGRGGKMVQARTAADGSLVELIARYPTERSELARSHFTRLTVALSGGQWSAQTQSVAFESRKRLASGSIRQSLFAATDEAGLPDAVAVQLADIFSGDIDFHRELKRGDTFSVVYEALTADGEPVTWNEGAGRVLAAEFVNRNKTYQAVWFNGPDGRGAYYSPDGSSRRRAFLASPMEFSRVTSGFAMRLHPLARQWRQHLGVDYGAPIGTPVRAVGDGVVDFAGRQNGYGNVVQVRHGGERSTLYAHLSRIDVRQGQHIEQGQRLGAVGMTGWSTGPHLHFEFRVGGQHLDPLVAAKAAETVPLDAGSRPRFAALARTVRSELDVAQTLSSQRATFE